MSNSEPHAPSKNRTTGGLRGWLIGAAAVVCALSWIALGTGLFLGMDTTTKVVLVTLAALSTEGVFWLSALVLGIRVFDARRVIGRRLRTLLANEK